MLNSNWYLSSVYTGLDAGAGFRSCNSLLPRLRGNTYLDSAIVEYFKAEAGERGYQTLINEALKNSIQAKTIEKTIWNVIRQELKEYKV